MRVPRLPSVRLSTRESVRSTDEEQGRLDVEGPKTPSSERAPFLILNLPVFTPPASPRPEPSGSPSQSPSPLSASPMSPHAFATIQQSPVRPQRTHLGAGRPFVGVDHEENELGALVQRTRPHRQIGGKRETKHRFCFPNATREVRRKMVASLVYGTITAIVFTTYLGLMFSSQAVAQQFHVLFILVILFTTLLFCHSLIRLCMLATRAQRIDREVMETLGPAGYANPVEPIRVVTALDQEAMGAPPPTTEAPPPAYGLWRCSVRADPNLLHWQRAEQPPLPESETQVRPTTATRPPSYVSDDGVEYVVSGAPRVTVASAEDALPPHPSEVGRA
ncbi:MAG: hypothetical protein M1832_000993 [Thelocarpon impressellum]|nr:MAG: hypothetical protein M1832_000993 [Thelocarpon impressellum]